MKIYSLQAVRGDTIPVTLNFTTADGRPIDISGWTVWMTAKSDRTLPDDKALFQVKVTSHTYPTAGISSFVVPATATASLVGPPGVPWNYFYDVQYRDGSGNIGTAIAGTITFSMDVTNALS